MDITRVETLIRFVLGGVFLVAATTKIVTASQVARKRFTEMLGLADMRASRLLVAFFPYGELFVAVWLLSGWRTSEALLAASLVLLAFLFIIRSALKRGYRGACQCFGSRSGDIGISTLIFDIALVFSSVWALVRNGLTLGVAGPSVFHFRPIDGAAYIFLVVWLVGAYLLMNKVESVTKLDMALKDSLCASKKRTQLAVTNSKKQ